MRKIKFFLATVYAICAAVNAWAGDIPVSTFFQHPQFSNVTISPTGRYLAFMGRDAKDPESYLLDILDLKTHKVLGHYALTDYKQVSYINWVSDDRIVFGTAVQSGSFDQPLSTGEIWAINADGTRFKGLAGTGKSGGVAFTYRYSWLLSDLMDDPRHILIATDTFKANPTVNKVDVLTGKGHKIGTSPFLNTETLYTDWDGNLRFAAGENDKTYKREIAYRDKDGEWKKLDDFLASIDPFDASYMVGLTPDGNAGYAIIPDSKGTLGLFHVDFKADKTDEIYADPEYDLSAVYDGDFNFPIYGYDDKTLIGFSYTTDLPVHIWLRPNDPKAQLVKGLQAAFPGQRVQIDDSTRDGSESVILVSSDVNPGDYYLYSKGKVQFLFSKKTGIDPKQMSPMHPISFQARDGLTIHGYLTLPPGVKMADAKDLPLVINPHGGPYGIRDFWKFDPEVQYMAHHGYAVLQVNYRGSGGYGTKFQMAGYKQWGGTMQDDLTDATHWAVKQGIADPKRLCIYGASYGGYAALEGVVKEPDLYKCAIGYVGVYDLPLRNSKSDTLRYRSLSRFFDIAVGTDEAKLKATSPVFHVKDIKANLFIAYGGADKTVDPENGDEMTEALKKAGKPFELLYYPNEGHGFYKVKHQDAFYQKLIGFLDANIGPDAKR